jgi:hypothetical protein
VASGSCASSAVMRFQQGRPIGDGFRKGTSPVPEPITSHQADADAEVFSASTGVMLTTSCVSSTGSGT